MYKEKFLVEAKKNELSDEFVSSHLIYAKNLISQNLPIVVDVKQLSLLLGIEITKLYNISNDSRRHYRHFKIPKKTGGYRTISEPYPTLKLIQKWIQDNILSYSNNNIFSKAFKKDVSIKDNAKFHRNQKVLINYDIQDYFGSITQYDVENFFSALGYYKDISMILSKFCCYKGSLPQGAITSPGLSNTITIGLDQELIDYALQNKLRYTRYADDISFSGDILPKDIYKYISKTLYKFGFQLNHKKSKVLKYYQRQVVTGIVVNKKMQKDKKYRNKIRQEVYYISKFGLDSHLEHNQKKETKKEYLENLLGRISHVLFVNPYDIKMSDMKNIVLEIYNSIE